MTVPAPPGRLRRLRPAMASDGLDGLIVSHPANVRWLSGYTGSNGVLCVTADAGRLLTDFRYATAVEPLNEAWEIEVVDQDLVGALAGNFPELTGGGRVGFEAARLPYLAWRTLEDAARSAGVELVPVVGLFEPLRGVKDEGEIERIREGARLTDEVYGELIEHGLAGRRERDVAWWIRTRLRELGAEDTAFDVIVASGAESAVVHAHPRDAEIPRGSLVVLDLGARLDGYCSDCTRTLATGPTSAEMKEVYELVARAQAECVSMVEPGRPCPDVHARARAIITEAGYGEYFNHGTGHGVGLEIHEEPRFRDGFGGTLEPGNVVTVEPGVYLPDRFGVRIEDLVVVTEEGREVLTQAPKSLMDVG
jgi:Xaa-Pro aminopeptidase